MEENNKEAAAEKRAKKLGKEVNYETRCVETTVAGGTGLKSYSFDNLPEDIKSKLGPFGLGHKLGDAAAGKEGAEAEEAIQKVYDGLLSGDWSVRAPAGPRVSIKSLADKVTNLSPADQEAAKALLTSLGVKIPGFNE